MEVGIVTDAFPPVIGGMQVFAGEYVTQLADHDSVDHVDVLAFEPLNGETEPVEHPDVSITRSGAARTTNRIKIGAEWLYAGDHDIVHSLTLHPGGLIAAVANKLFGVERTFVTAYGTDTLSVADHPLHSRVRQLIFDLNDEVLFFSDSTREKTADAYPGTFQSRTVYPGVPTLPDPDGSVTLPNTDGTFTVVTVTRLVERKGIDDLIAAVAPLDSVSLWILGDGRERTALEAQCAELGIEDRVAFLGSVERSSVSDFYDSADLFCLPSRHLESKGDVEGLGLVFLEAQRQGVPVVGTDSGGIPEAISDGETGLVVEEGNRGSLREAIQQIAESPEMRERFTAVGPEFVDRKFSWTQCVENHLDAYRGN